MSQPSRFSRCVLLLLLAGRGAAFAGSFELISRVDRAPDRFGDSGGASLSADGRYVAFVSDAGNLIPGVTDENSAPDVFLRDRLTGITTLVTHAVGSPDVAAPSSSRFSYARASLSADGRYVAFVSTAENLAPGVADTNGVPDAFLWDRVTGATTLISRASGRSDATANGSSFEVHISADGQYVALLSGAPNLVRRQTAPAGLPTLSNLFLWRRSSGTLTLVTWRADSSTVTAHGYASNPRLSADGRYVAFDDSADDLVPGQTRSSGDSVFLYNRSTGTVSLVSHAAGNPRSPASSLSHVLGLSADGRRLLFVSHGTDLIAGQTGPVPNVFLYERATGEIRRVGTNAENGVLSADGRWAFFSNRQDESSHTEIFLYDPISGTSGRIAEGSLALGETSADGRFLVYSGNGGNVFLYERTAGGSVLVSHTRDSAAQPANGVSSDPAISADGGVVVFASRATDLAEELLDPNGFAGLYDYRRSSGEVSLLTPSDPENPVLSSAAESGLGDMSADGRFVVFVSSATNLVPGQVDGYFAGPDGGFWTRDVFLRDRKTGTTTLLTRAGDDPASRVRAVSGYKPAISADGRVAAFLVSTDKDNPFLRLALYDVATDTERLVDHAAGNPGVPDAGYVNEAPALSADGRWIAYTCVGCSLVPGQQDGHPGPPQASDVFLYDRVTDTHLLVSHAGGAATTTANASSRSARISADGRWVVFASQATDLAPGGTYLPSTWNVFLFDRETGAVTLVSHAAGSPGPGDGSALFPEISADGRWIAYLGSSGNLVPGQTGGAVAFNVFLYDRTTGANVLVSHKAGSPVTPGNRTSGGGDPAASLSADGRWLAYLSGATDLVAGVNDRNGADDVFLYDRATGASRLISSAKGSAATTANRGALRARLSADGRRIAFQSAATDLAPGSATPLVALYLQDRQTGSRARVGLIHNSFRLPALFWGSFDVRLSADGSKVGLTSGLPLAPGDFNRAWDVYVYTAP